MIISHQHQFIFIKTHKTASTSIEIALSSICSDSDVITPISPKDERMRNQLGFRGKQNLYVPLSNYSLNELYNSFILKKRKKYERHMNAQEIRDNLSHKVWDNYYKFSIERNPYDRIVSLFFWRGGFEKYETVYQFLNSTKRPGLLTTDKYYIDEKMAIDKVYQFENLDFMLQDLSKRFELREPLKLPKHQAKSFTRKEKDYRKVLDRKSKLWIEETYADVIKRFDYKW